MKLQSTLAIIGTFVTVLSTFSTQARASQVPAGPTAPVAYRTDFMDTVLVLSLDKSLVEGLLGPEQELAPQKMTDADHNPVLLIHAQYPNMLDLTTANAQPLKYDEFAVYIPNVRVKSGYTCGGASSGSAAYMPVLYLNQQAPVDLGVKYYGFNKFLANVEASEDSFRVSSEDGTLLYSAKFGKEEPLNLWGSFRALWYIKPIMPNALMGRLTDAGGNINSIWSGGIVDPKTIKMTSLSVEAQDVSLLFKGLESFVGMPLSSKGINAQTLGSYRVRGTLTGTMPVKCVGPEPEAEAK
jgi:hypothetical protein